MPPPSTLVNRVNIDTRKKLIGWIQLDFFTRALTLYLHVHPSTSPFNNGLLIISPSLISKYITFLNPVGTQQPPTDSFLSSFIFKSLFILQVPAQYVRIIFAFPNTCFDICFLESTRNDFIEQVAIDDSLFRFVFNDTDSSCLYLVKILSTVGINS